MPRNPCLSLHDLAFVWLSFHDLDKSLRITTRQSILILSNTNFIKTYQCSFFRENSKCFMLLSNYLALLTNSWYDWKKLFLILINGVWNLGLMVKSEMFWLVWPDQLQWCFCRLSNVMFPIPLDADAISCSVSGVCERKVGREGRRGRWEMEAFHLSLVGLPLLWRLSAYTPSPAGDIRWQNNEGIHSSSGCWCA